jgi:hypothetical protein
MSPKKAEEVKDSIGKVVVKIDKIKDLAEEVDLSTKETELFTLAVLRTANEKSVDTELKSLFGEIEKAVDKSPPQMPAKIPRYIDNLEKILQTIKEKPELVGSPGFTDSNISDYLNDRKVTGIDWQIDPNTKPGPSPPQRPV